MPLVNLLLEPPSDPREWAVYDFEHMMAHRTPWVIMAPLTRFSVLPYLLEPALPPTPRPATNWPLNHQQAHNDVENHVPSAYSAGTFGVPLGQNLVDTDFTDPRSRSWWTFVNHQQHHIVNNVMSPLPTALPPPVTPPWWETTGATWPFW